MPWTANAPRLVACWPFQLAAALVRGMVQSHAAVGGCRRRKLIELRPVLRAAATPTPPADDDRATLESSAAIVCAASRLSSASRYSGASVEDQSPSVLSHGNQTAPHWLQIYYIDAKLHCTWRMRPLARGWPLHVHNLQHAHRPATGYVKQECSALLLDRQQLPGMTTAAQAASSEHSICANRHRSDADCK